MPAHRFYLNDSLQSPNVTLTGPEFHHLKNVMRARPGDTVELVNGEGSLATARLQNMTPSEALFEITHTTTTPPPSTRIILAQAFTRPALLDWIVEKGTELGAAEFWLFPGDQSEKKELTPNQLERLHHLILSALKQCGRLYLPLLHIKPALSFWTTTPGTLLYGSLSPDAPPLKPSTSPIIMTIGPEKGLSSQELSHLSSLGAAGVTLHPNILRTETAALCALSQLSFLQL